MRHVVMISALVTLNLSLVPYDPIDRNAMLRAIAEVETGNESRAVGTKGERSAWQFTETTWERLTGVPFEWATTQPGWARMVAHRNLERIIRSLSRKTDKPTPKAIARAWNPRAPKDYAERVANLYAVYAAKKEGKP